MSSELWREVDDYIAGLFVPDDEVLKAALAASDEAGLPPHHVAPNQGKLLYLLALARGARRILEIGTLGGYSTIWLARAVAPGGLVITLELDARHAEVAARNVARAGLDEAVEIRVGSAAHTLREMVSERSEPFDMIFIDADKENSAVYLESALSLAAERCVLVVDNVIRGGLVIEAEVEDRHVVGTRVANESLARNERIAATAIQTVGVKGHDGFAIAIVNPTG